MILLALVAMAAGSLPAAGGKKIVLVAGTRSHGPGDHEYEAGCYLLANFLKQNGARPVVVTGGWPQDESVFNGAAEVVLYMDGGDAHPLLKGNRLETLAGLMKKGVGLACLHYAVEVPKEKAGPQFLEWIGGYYERPYSQNPFNDVELIQTAPEHPISRGWKSFRLKDEWYYRIRFQEGDKRVTPVLAAMVPVDKPNRETLGWATQRADGGRGFGFTGLHPHRNWMQP
ncbi:MAG: ThuA domain-containing protein, partial [Acidobacteria bacterium]|nr:ThuA domain-containing protein [Acidobacteriota bacterium]